MAARQNSKTPVPLSLVCPFLVTGGLAESDEPFEENLDVRDRRDQEFCAAGFDQISHMSSLDAWRRILKEAPTSQMRPLVPANASPAMLCDIEPRSLRLITHAYKQWSKLPRLWMAFSNRSVIRK